MAASSTGSVPCAPGAHPPTNSAHSPARTAAILRFMAAPRASYPPVGPWRAAVCRYAGMMTRMQTRRFGRLGWQVSEVGYGLWGMGGWSGSDDEQSLSALEYAIERGCTFFDTALAYGDGHSERLLGQVLKRHPHRTVYVATKIPP